MAFFVDGMRRPSRDRGQWECDDCGAINGSDDATCECVRAAERIETDKRLIIMRLQNLSPGERRRRLGYLSEGGERRNPF
jgi:hypothetical protein